MRTKKKVVYTSWHSLTGNDQTTDPRADTKILVDEDSWKFERDLVENEIPSPFKAYIDCREQEMRSASNSGQFQK